jgi:beta-lactamase regulating signal transducer with metallopeptidase domain
MGELVTVLNAAGGAFVAFAAHMLVQSSALIILLAALDLVLRRRVKAVVRYWIWLLVLAKLILPPSFSAPTGVAYWAGGKLPTLSGPIEPVVGELSSPSLPADGTAVPAEPRVPDVRPSVGYAPQEPPVVRPDNTALQVTPQAPSATWQALVLFGWAIVVIVMGILLAQRALFIHRLVAQSRAPGPEIVELLGQCARRMGVRTDLTVKLSPLSASPSVCGLRRPVILIPEGMLSQLPVHEVRSVLFHELAHIKRGDLWLNLLQAVLQVVYFYHPLLWLANVRIRRVREQAVDETVLAALGEEAEDYPRTLLSVSRAAFGQPVLSLRLLGVVESEKALMDRIRHMVGRPFPKSARLGFTGLILVFAAGAALLPMARAESDTPRAAETAGSQQADNSLSDVLSFDGLIVDDFEGYTDNEGSRIAQAWLDGSTNGTGSVVGNAAAPFAERTIVHGGKQSMPLSYDNTKAPFYSEAEREFVPAQDWSPGRMNTLSVWIRGNIVSFGQSASATFVMSAVGTDIWNLYDQCRFAYARLTGDGSIVARVDSLASTEEWAKAGVMIRSSLRADAANAYMYVTPVGRRVFHNRAADKTGDCRVSQSRAGAISLPSWVKVERKGNVFTGYYSTDGLTWVKQPEKEETREYQSTNPRTIPMPSSVCIGFALTSHTRDGSPITALFSQVETEGVVRGEWQVASIGIDQPGNSPDNMYVIVRDSDDKAALVTNPDPIAVTKAAWTEWKIPLSSFTGVNLSKVKKLYIGVGGRQIPVRTGTGRIYIDDIRVSRQ